MVPCRLRLATLPALLLAGLAPLCAPGTAVEERMSATAATTTAEADGWTTTAETTTDAESSEADGWTTTEETTTNAESSGDATTAAVTTCNYLVYSAQYCADLAGDYTTGASSVGACTARCNEQTTCVAVTFYPAWNGDALEKRCYIETDTCTQQPSTSGGIVYLKGTCGPGSAVTQAPGGGEATYAGMATWGQSCFSQSHSVQEQLMDEACASAFAGSHAATIDEIVTRAIVNLPSTSSAAHWTVLKCGGSSDEQCHGTYGGNSRHCVHRSIAWPVVYAPGNGWDSTCCSSTRSTVCVLGGTQNTRTRTTTSTTTRTTSEWSHGRREVLYTGLGSSSVGENTWSGWYSAGSDVVSGDGKRAAYDGMPLVAIQFHDASGAWAEYHLIDEYIGWTLLEIVQHCMGSARSNDGSATWDAGHCSIATLLGSLGIPDISSFLRLGVGDGSSDSGDWALFMLQIGNANGDFAGRGAYAFGSEGETNTGYSGQVWITGVGFEADPNATSTTRTTTTLDVLPVHVFTNSVYVDTGREVANVLADLAAAGIPHSTFTSTGAGSWSPPGAALLVPELEGSDLTLNSNVRDELLQWIGTGGRLVVCGCGGALRFLNSLFGWSLADGSRPCSSCRSELLAGSCELLCGGPAQLDTRDAVCTVRLDSVPAGALAPYVTRPGSQAWVLEVAHGPGRVLYLGHDWFAAERAQWGELLRLALVAGATAENTTTRTSTTTSPSRWGLLYTGLGSSSAGQNTWSGWHSAGGTVASGDGKRAAYDSAPLEALRFSDASGAWAEYRLTGEYAGWTLLQIVEHCMRGDLSNDGSAAWNEGHCAIGALEGSWGISGISPVLRVGVGDGSADSRDWALFMVLTGNGGGDFQGNAAYAVASEGKTNTGFAGQVTIEGLGFEADPNATTTTIATNDLDMLSVSVIALIQSRKVTNMLADLEARGIPYTFNYEENEAILFPELEMPFPPGTDFTAFIRWANAGGRLVVSGCGYGHQFLNSAFGWNLLSAGSARSSTSTRSVGTCGLFCEGPPRLGSRYSVCPVTSLPFGALVVYAGESSDAAWVFEMPYGLGRVVYLGFNWFDAVRGEWPMVLQLSLSRTSLGENATVATTLARTSTTRTTTTATTTTAAPLACSGLVRGSTRGRPSSVGNPAGDAVHAFCPNSTGTYTFATCGSDFDTYLHVYTVGLQYQVASCDDCGPCGLQTVLSTHLDAGQCYDVVVDGFNRNEGSYELRVTCCSREASCNRRGAAYAKYAGSSQMTCGCTCDWPYGGTACERCHNPTDVLINGTCLPCLPSQERTYVALANSSFRWHVQYARPECASAIQLMSYSSRHSPAWQPLNLSSDGVVDVHTPDCQPSDHPHDCQLGLYANGCRVGSVLCAATAACGVPTGASGADAATAGEAAGPQVVHVHVVDRSALTAQAVLSFYHLLGTRAGGRFPSLLVSSFASERLQTVRGTLPDNGSWGKAPGLAELQEVLNRLLSPTSAGSRVRRRLRAAPAASSPVRSSCPLAPHEGRLLDSAVAMGTEILVLAGDMPLCEDLRGRLRTLVRGRARILWLGQGVAPPMYVVGVTISPNKDPGTSWHPELCQFAEFLERRGDDNNGCVPGTLTFAPASVRVLERARISVQGICGLQACCIGDRCSRFVDPRPGWMACYLPLVDATGAVNLTVVLQDGQRVTAAQPLSVVPARWAFRVQRPLRSSSLVQGIFKDYADYVTIEQATGYYAQSGAGQFTVCCHFVAVGLHNYAVMGILSPVQCFDSPWRGSILGSMPTPSTVDHEAPFPQPLGMGALRCYSPRLSSNMTDGASSVMPDEAKPNGTAAQLSWTLLLKPATRNKEQRVNGYVDHLLARAGHTSGGQALRAVRLALVEGAGLRSLHLPSRKQCGESDDPDFEGNCYWAWSAHAMDAGEHLLSAGFYAFETDWNMSNAIRGDIVVLPAFAGEEPETNATVSHPSGDIAVMHNDTADRPWVSDFVHAFGGLRRLRKVDAVSKPMIYRLREDAELPPEPKEQVLPVPVLQDLVPSTAARRDLVVDWAERDREDGNVARAMAAVSTHFRCPAVWERFSTMPRELRPDAATWRSSGEFRCLEMSPTSARQFGVRCCFDRSNRYIPGWPSRLVIGSASKPLWHAIKEEGVERLALMDWTPGATRRPSTCWPPQPLPLQLALLANGVYTDVPSSTRALTHGAKGWQWLDGLCPNAGDCVYWYQNETSMDCAIVFRGSDFPLDVPGEWAADTLRTRSGQEYEVRAAFLERYQRFQSMQSLRDKHLVKDVHSWILRGAKGCRRLHLVGHSFGGALASLAYTEFAGVSNVFLHTFGQPRVFKGTPPFDCFRATRYYMQRGDCTDPVSALLTPPGLGFKHGGRPIALLEPRGVVVGQCGFAVLPASLDMPEEPQNVKVLLSLSRSVNVYAKILVAAADVDKLKECAPLHKMERYIGALRPRLTEEARSAAEACEAKEEYSERRPPAPSTNNPFDDLSKWTPRRPPGWGWGDPHCNTYDGLSFECNYAGEAVLTRCGNWTVHVIAERVGGSGNATVITRFAMRYLSDTFIGVVRGNESATGYALYLNGEAADAQSEHLTVFVVNNTVTVEDSAGDTVEATFQTGLIALQISPAEACFNRTSGLMGNNNANPEDDLQVFNSSEVLSPNASSEDIYSAVVLSWCVTDVADSLFPAALFVACDLTFRPWFMDDNQTLAACPEACNGVGTCCFDVKAGGEALLNASLDGQRKLSESVEESMSFNARWPPRFLTAPSALAIQPPWSSASLLANFSAMGDGLAMTALACSICPEFNASLAYEHGINCSVSGLGGQQVTLALHARSLPPGYFSCTATDADGSTAESATDVVVLPPLTTTTSTTTVTTNTSTVTTATSTQTTFTVTTHTTFTVTTGTTTSAGAATSTAKLQYYRAIAAPTTDAASSSKPETRTVVPRGAVQGAGVAPQRDPLVFAVVWLLQWRVWSRPA